VVLHPRGFAKLWGPYRTNGRALESATDDTLGITAELAAGALVTAIRDAM
jgi:hypothetical protein